MTQDVHTKIVRKVATASFGLVNCHALFLCFMSKQKWASWKK